MTGSLRKGSLVMVAALAFGCSTTPSPNPSVPDSSAPSAQPSTLTAASPATSPSSQSPETSPSVRPATLRKDSIARVLVNDLLVRSAPGIQATSRKLKPLLNRDHLVFVVDGPVRASGYDWYQVQSGYFHEYTEPDFPFGWVAAASRGGQPWLAQADISCPPLPIELETVVAQTTTSHDGVGSYFGLACYGGRKIMFTARYAAPELPCPEDLETQPVWAVQPAMFAGCWSGNYLYYKTDDRPALGARADPKITLPDLGVPNADRPETWPTVEVTGQFDYPRARQCRAIRNPYAAQPESVPERGAVILGCRGTFVVTSIRRIGSS
jgi:hypothetical protein